MMMKRASVLAMVSFVLCLPLAAQNPPAPPPAPVVVPTAPTAAQAAAAGMGKTISNDQIADAIKKSGLSQAQVQERLKSAGYDPSLASPFFAAQQGQPGAPVSAQTEAFAKALSSLGILTESTDKPDAEQEKTRTSDARQVNRVGGIFGREIFNNASTAFDPITSGPVDAAYRLGVGDQLQLVITGQVELAYQLDLRRDGTVIIPQVGQVSIAGLTLESARTVLKNRMAQSYSGLTSGEARLDLSIGKIRSNAIFVIGEVSQPGAIQVNALSTVFHALARAGGPSDRGSFRSIEVRRGGQTIRRLDLYDYLLKGDATDDIRTEQGDVIYVPLSARNVAVVGAVRRPRIFELKGNEGFKDLLSFAGGLLAMASVERVQIDRILPAERRSPGVERVKVDVQLKGDLDSLSRVPLLDGDIVTVFGIGDTRRNVVSIRGEVFQPGDYQLRDKMTLGELLQRSQGMLPWALGDRVKVVRLIVPTGRTELFSVDALGTGRDFALQEFDEVEVLDGRTAYPGGRIAVTGAVNRPNVRAFSEHESLRDAIERSGGFTEEAQWVDVSRRRTGATYSDTTSVVFSVPVDAQFATSATVGAFTLQRDDRIFVRSSPGFRSQRMVLVRGEFKYTGEYAVTENKDRIRDVITRAGGVLPSAYPESFSLSRGGRRVAIDFARVMSGDDAHNIFVQADDQLSIDVNPRTVLVTGAVDRTTLVKYDRGRSVQDYIELAGGPSERGQAFKAVVAYPSGLSKRVRRVALFFHTSPEVQAGSTITVPEKPESKTSVSDIWARVLTTATTIASIAITYVALKK
jgi:polysaccharide biosynthesis/export protein